VLRGTYAYTHNVVTGFTNGDPDSDPSAGRSTDKPGILIGLDNLGRLPLWTSFTDPLSRTTTLLLDAPRPPLPVIAPARRIPTHTRDDNGWVTRMADPLNRVTTFVRDSAGYLTQQTNPDGSTVTLTYQAPSMP